MLVSWAQNAEDVVLARAFRGQEHGLYVDIGASDPTAHSVTKLFYDRGWRGINVDAHPDAHAALERGRPDDINLGVGVADEPGTRHLHLGEGGHVADSTFRTDVAAVTLPGARTTPITVTTLAAIMSEHVGDRPVDFLKIDVEGYEREVILGGDWERWKPRVVVVEATWPHTTTHSHEEWEPLLLDAGYALTLFDGLNRFYARADDEDLRTLLAAPANVFDDWRRRSEVELEATVSTQQEGLVVREGQVDALIDALDERTRACHDLAAQVERETELRRVAEGERRAADEQRRVAEAERLAADEQRRAASAELDAMRRSRWWRLGTFPRRVRSFFR